MKNKKYACPRSQHAPNIYQESLKKAITHGFTKQFWIKSIYFKISFSTKKVKEWWLHCSRSLRPPHSRGKTTPISKPNRNTANNCCSVPSVMSWFCSFLPRESPCSQGLSAGMNCSRYPQACVAPEKPPGQTMFPPALFPLTALPTISLLLLVDLFVLGPLLPIPGPQLQEAVHKLEHLGLTWQDEVAAGSFQNMTQWKIWTKCPSSVGVWRLHHCLLPENRDYGKGHNSNSVFLSWSRLFTARWHFWTQFFITQQPFGPPHKMLFLFI